MTIAKYGLRKILLFERSRELFQRRLLDSPAKLGRSKNNCVSPVIVNLTNLLLIAIFNFAFLTFNWSEANAQEAEFAPNRLIVKYKNGKSPRDLQEKVNARASRAQNILGQIQNRVEDFNLQRQGEKTPEEALRIIQGADRQNGVVANENLFQNKTDQENIVSNLDDINLLKTNSLKSVTELRKYYESLPEVEYAELDYKVFATTHETPNDPYYPKMWGLTKIQLPDAWDITKGSNNVIVAVVDSGIDYNHEDMPTNIIKGRDYYNNDNDPMDDYSHGTHVAGTIGALVNNAKGVSGINWNVKLMAIKVLGDLGIGWSSGAQQGIQYAADNGAKVINLSVGERSPCSSAYQDVINYARNKGVVLVTAAGNNNVDASTFSPASCNGVITVAATGPNDQRSYYSNWGSIIDIAAPGGDNFNCWEDEGGRGSGYRGDCWINSTVLKDSSCDINPAPEQTLERGYCLKQGTSMAAPHVTGVAALLLSVNPNLTPDHIEQIIKDSGDVIPSEPVYNPIYPIGKRLNAYKALLAIAPATPSPTNIPTPVPTATPTLSPTSIPTSTPAPISSPTPTSAPTAAPTQPPSPTPTPTPAPGDINHDGTVDIADYNIWRCEFLGNGVCGSPSSNKSSDLNSDNSVDILDFGVWLNGF